MRSSDMPVRYAFVDIHCHLLPGLDDGPQSWEESLEMARMAVSDGFVAIVATPHQLGNHAVITGEVIRQRTEQFQRRLHAAQIPLQVSAGADVRIEPELVDQVRSGQVLTLADRGRQVLLELPHELYVSLDRALAELRRAGLQGVLSHPERNRGILARPEILSHLLDAGCLLQVTASSLLGAFGPQVQQLAEHIAAQQMLHFLATDAHGCHSRRPLMQQAFLRLQELAGRETALRACCENPARVLAGQEVPGGQRRVKRARWRWFGGRKAG